MRRFAFLFLLMPLAGCLDLDLSIAFLSDEEAKVSSTYKMTRQLFDMQSKTAEEACLGGKSTLDETGFTCVNENIVKVEDLLNKSVDPTFLPATGEEMPTDVLKITRLENGKIGVTFDTDRMLEGNGDKPSADDPMADAFKMALAGHSVVIRVSGHEIVETTGILSEDGKEAKLVIPLTDILEEDPKSGGMFTVELETEESCLLGFICF